MTRTYQVWIPGELPSRNESELAARASKYAGSSLKSRYTQKVALCALGCRQIGWVPMERYTVKVHFTCKSKRKDPDNVIGGIKYVLDGLQVGGVVLNDGWANVAGICFSWDCDPAKPGVLVTLEEV